MALLKILITVCTVWWYKNMTWILVYPGSHVKLIVYTHKNAGNLNYLFDCYVNEIWP